MTTPDEEITMRQADVEALHARLAEAYEEANRLKKRNNALAWLWEEAKEQAEEWRNEAVNGDKDECARLDAPLPWEPQSIVPDPEEIRLAKTEAGWRDTDKFRIDEL